MDNIERLTSELPNEWGSWVSSKYHSLSPVILTKVMLCESPQNGGVARMADELETNGSDPLAVGLLRLCDFLLDDMLEVVFVIIGVDLGLDDIPEEEFLRLAEGDGQLEEAVCVCQGTRATPPWPGFVNAFGQITKALETRRFVFTEEEEAKIREVVGKLGLDHARLSRTMQKSKLFDVPIKLLLLRLIDEKLERVLEFRDAVVSAFEEERELEAELDEVLALEG